MAKAVFLSLLFLLLCSSSHGAVQDFCVADVSLPQSPAGYSCKDVKDVTADDFVFSFGTKPGNTSPSPFRFAVSTAFAPTYAGANGLDISALKADMAPGGAVPLHSHPGASEIIFVTRGVVIAGFVSSTNNVLYSKTLNVGDTMLFPKGQVHFTVNVGHSTATVFAVLNSGSPGVQITSLALFGNSFPAELVEKVTLIDVDEVKRLKALLGGN